MAEPASNCAKLSMEHGFTSSGAMTATLVEREPRKNYQWILHDWNDEECLKIPKHCKEAIPCKGKGGKVIIIDIVLDNQKEIQHQLKPNSSSI
ncbi:hypothetical protein RJ640_022550 [Escallonia rubra]|uniref:O-methyltransferase C-terminal domain-containing protein n=1 Tax=Escallonia rubra TaxID=112253 RepID=A0AA88R3A8_9ASTE|nr:hypothetical protein RJ640_022550 [Escallonia rubra]